MWIAGAVCASGGVLALLTITNRRPEPATPVHHHCPLDAPVLCARPARP
jgi:hypothetical protein